MNNLKVKEMFDEIYSELNANQDKIQNLNGKMQFDFTADNNGKWCVEFTDGKAFIVEGAVEDATFTLFTRYNLFYDLHTGKISHDEATMTGEFNIAGDEIFGSKAGKAIKECSKYI